MAGVLRVLVHQSVTLAKRVRSRIPSGTVGRMNGDEAGADWLSAEFGRAMHTMCVRFKTEIDYDPVTFRQMLAEHGGVEAARRLLRESRA